MKSYNTTIIIIIIIHLDTIEFREYCPSYGSVKIFRQNEYFNFVDEGR